MRKPFNTRGMTLAEKLDFYTVKTKGCWKWTAGKDKDGYPRLWFDGSTHRAHRLSWEMVNGDIPESDNAHGMCVLHKCDNPECTNPAHLFLGTIEENVQDRVNKNRSVGPKGQRQHASKLTADDVYIIRSMLANNYAASFIAKSFRVHRTSITAIDTGMTWSWLA